MQRQKKGYSIAEDHASGSRALQTHWILPRDHWWRRRLSRLGYTKEGTLILGTLQWTILPDGETQKQKRWNIPNSRDAHARAFAFKLLMGFLATLK
jgi:hypothetical protein